MSILNHCLYIPTQQTPVTQLEVFITSNGNGGDNYNWDEEGWDPDNTNITWSPFTKLSNEENSYELPEKSYYRALDYIIRIKNLEDIEDFINNVDDRIIFYIWNSATEEYVINQQFRGIGNSYDPSEFDYDEGEIPDTAPKIDMWRVFQKDNDVFLLYQAYFYDGSDYQGYFDKIKLQFN